MWKKAIYFISDHFWKNGQYNNVILSEQVSYSVNSVYKYEVVTVEKKLIEIMTDDDISKFANHYNCKTMKSEINKRLEIIRIMALRKILCKKESKQIRKQITNMVFRSENGGIHLPVLAARSMLYDGMRTAGVNNDIRHRAY